MARYSSFCSISDVIKMDRARMMKALKYNELVVGEDENGFIYEVCDPEEVKRFIMDTFEEYAYQWQNANDCANVVSDMLDEHKVKYNWRDFVKRMYAKSAQRYDPEDLEDEEDL